MGSELWWSFHKCCQVGCCSASLQNFFRDAQDHHKAHTRALEQSEQPSRVCFTMKVMYRRIFYTKIALKSSLPDRFLTKKLFFTFDFRMMNFAFLSPRNEIWKRLGVFLKLSNALDAKYASILKKLDFASETFIFTSIKIYWVVIMVSWQL